MVPHNKVSLKEEIVEEKSKEESVKAESIKEILIGSNVKWNNPKDGEELTGIVEKITEKSYKICCKPGKQSGEKGSVYMVPKDRVQLN